MQAELSLKAAIYRARHHHRKAWNKVVTVLASIVVFCTTYALILPAITMEPNYVCGLEAHVHEDACYQLPAAAPVTTMVCEPAALGIHEHTEACYDETGELRCGIADFVLHTHQDDCYDADGELMCFLPEIEEHIHTMDACWQQPHVHEDLCYTKHQGELLCTIEEGSVHTHGDACRTTKQNRICGLDEAAPHTHGAACYTQTRELVCRLEESAGHTHDTACYDDTGAAVCGLPEIAGHTHTDVCYQVTETFTCQLEETEGHTHSDACFETVQELTCTQQADVAHSHSETCYAWATELTCTQPTAGEGAVPTLVCQEQELYVHTHETACYDPAGQLICGLLEVSEHIHDGSCFAVTYEQSTEPVLVCGLEVHEHSETCLPEEETADSALISGAYCGLAEHEHVDACYSADGALMCTMAEHAHEELCWLAPADTSAVETEEEWLADLPELTYDNAADLIAVAESQLGYAESDVNYIVTEDGEILYYSRYAAWWSYGAEPYGDWNAKFVAFCLENAGIPSTVVPVEPETATWPSVLKLSYYDQWRDNDGTFAPIAADLVFFDTDNDGTADRAGIITAVDTENSTISVILERRGLVQQVNYDLDDDDILGYARIPGNEPTLDLMDYSNVQNVVNLIDAMPSCDEIYAQLDTYYEADDTEGEQAYLMRVGQQGQYAYACYQALTEAEQAQVSNIQKLMESSAIWSAVTLEEPVDGTVYYCGKIAHEHSTTCYNTENELICGYSEEHTHVKACLVDPSAYEETTDEEASLEGQYVYHSPYNLKYQESSHDLDKFDVVTFVLIPEKDIGEDQGESWLPNIIDWNGRADANYIVAYCSDAMTSTSTTGATYATFTLDNARFTSEEQRRVLSGIIAHSYPFITADEMKAQLKAAVANGEITEAKVLDCTESEYIAASQWAIWQTTLLAQSFTYADASVFEYTDQCLNPLTDVGLTDNTEINNTVKAIKNWLVQQIEPVELEVDSYDYQVTPTEYGLYDLAVTVTLNREVENGELAEYGLAIGRQSAELHKLEAGESKFTATLESLTSEELTQAQVVLTVGGEHMQAYFFDSNNHQDLISGNWEYYADDLSFEVGVDTIDISVTKKWTDDAEGHPDVTIQLFANGEICGDPVTLSETNSWTYCWQDMLKTDALGELINYTIQEELIDGYSSTIEKHGTDAVEEVQFWEAVETVEPDGQYVLLSSFINEAGLQVSNGALTWSENDSRDTSTTDDLLSWNYVDLSEPQKTSPNAIWTTTAGENGGFYLQNNGDWMSLCGTYSIYLSADYRTEYFFSDGLLCVDSAGSEFFMDIFSTGYAYTSDDTAVATTFMPYKLITEERPKGDINFVVTNTKIEGETTSLTVTKQWAGRPDGIYPAEAVVNLTQNGQTYGGQVHLSAENGWTYTWTGLPVLDADEEAFVYSVEEVGNADYVATAELTEITDETGVASYQVLLTNTWIPAKSAVRLEKVDFYNGETFLPGAKFDIYLASDTVGDRIPGASSVTGVLYDQTTVGDAGTVELSLPTNETYYLVETQAPEGYNLSGTAIGFTVTQRGTLVMLELVSGEDLAQTTDGAPAVLTVKNKPGYTLPETGGLGTAVYYLGGVVMMGLPIFAGVYRHKKRRATGS